MVLLPIRDYANLSYLKENFNLRLLKDFLHSVRLGISLWQHVTYVNISLLNLENKKKNLKFKLQKEDFKLSNYLNYSYSLNACYFSYV